MINTKNIDGDSPIRTKTFYGRATADTLTTGADKGVVPIVGLDAYGGEVIRVDAMAGTAPAGSALSLVINNGSTLLASISFAAGSATTNTTTITNNGTVSDGDYLDIDCTAIGSGTAGGNVLVAVTVKVHGSIEG